MIEANQYKNCKVCGTEFKAFRTTDRFCSSKCSRDIVNGSNKNRKSAPYVLAKKTGEPLHRIKAKQQARILDGNRCRLREYLPEQYQHHQHDTRMEVHHVMYLSEGGPDIVENLVTLCLHCHHQIAHRYKHEFQWLLLKIRNGEDWFDVCRDKFPSKCLVKLSGIAAANRFTILRGLKND